MNFPKPPKSAIFSKLDAFLPQLAMENHKLEKAINDGKGSNHNIEIEEETQSDQEKSEGDSSAQNKQIIEMNFALGLMENSDTEEDDNEKENKPDHDQKKNIQARIAQNHPQQLPKLKLRTQKSSTSSKALIQELN